jgi:sortase A
MAGHRDTFFRPLRQIEAHDEIIFDTAAQTYHYRVSSTEIVDPHDVAVLKSGKKDELTLVTCYPFYYLGRAPKRFIVHADLAD